MTLQKQLTAESADLQQAYRWNELLNSFNSSITRVNLVGAAVAATLLLFDYIQGTSTSNMVVDIALIFVLGILWSAGARYAKFASVVAKRERSSLSIFWPIAGGLSRVIASFFAFLGIFSSVSMAFS